MFVSPIAVFAFNRPDHLRRTLDALARNAFASESALTIFCDGPRTEAEQQATDAVRTVARSALGFASVEVVCREANLGCAASVIGGLQHMFARYERLIVIEDDILCSEHTLTFLNSGLERYEKRKTVFNIAAWSPPPRLLPVRRAYTWDVYAIPRFNCWGWASWRDRFESVDWSVEDYAQFRVSSRLRAAFDAGGADLSAMLDSQMCGNLNTWDIRMDYARFKQGGVGINPVRSYTTNIGMGCGTHTTTLTDRFDNDITVALPVAQVRWIEQIFVDSQILKKYQAAVIPHSSWWKRLLKEALSAMGLLDTARILRNKIQKR